MPRFALRLGLLFVALAAFAPPASAQISWNVTYDGSGWTDTTPIGSTTVGQARHDSINSAIAYLNTVLDGRGNVNITLTGSSGTLGSTLAFFGATQGQVPGSFQNGMVYQGVRSGEHPFSSNPDGSGTFFFGNNFNYAGQTQNPSNFDMVTVAIHELTHGLGFASNTTSNGSSSIGGEPAGSPGTYATFDKYLQRGNGTGGGLFNIDITNSSFGTFNGPASTLINGNNPSTGLFFGGKYAREVLGGPVPLFAPNPYQDGSSTSHVVDSNAVMNPDITPNTQRRFQRYEIAMLLDIGWNTYNWNATTGNFGDGISNLAQSRWRTDQGIIFDAAFNDYNTFGHTNQAPILPVYGQVTSNIVMNFGGSGSSSYTSTNDLGSIRLARLNLDSSSTQTNTITGGTLQFGVNSDGTASVLTPKIVQSNTGAFTITSNIVTTNTTSAPGGGWTGFTVDGTGSGKVTLGGVISGDGSLTKSGNFTLELNGSSANSFTGVTTVTGGALLLNKTPTASAIVGDVNIGTGGTVRLAAADQIQGDGTGGKKITLSGGTLSTGATTGFGDSVGALELTASSTIALGSGAHSLKFTGIAGTPTGTLTITGWSGDLFAPGTAGKILFSDIGTTPNTTFATFLGSVQFDTFGTGGTFLDTGTPGLFELAPVPEPSTILAVAFGALGMGALARRRSLRGSLVSWDL